MSAALLFHAATCALASFPQDISIETRLDRSRPPTRQEVTHAVYDVHDLLDRTSPVWQAARRSVAEVEGEIDAHAVEDSTGSSHEHDQAVNLRELARLLRAFAAPAFVEGDRIDCLGSGQLAITAGAEQQAFAREFLTLQRECRDSTQVSLRLVTGSKNSFAELGLPISGTYASTQEIEEVFGQIQHGNFDLLTAPTLTTRVLQHAQASVLSAFSYVKEYHVQIVQPSGELIADPVIEVINEGVLCRMRSLALPGGSFGLTIDVENVDIQRPVPTRTVRIASGVDTEGEIMLPEVLRARLSGDVRLADGATAVFVTPAKEDQDLALFVSVSRVTTATR